MTQAPLYSECKRCAGDGTWIQEPESRGSSRVIYGPRPCPDCNGVGAIPTAEGQQVLDLINRWHRAGQLR